MNDPKRTVHPYATGNISEDKQSIQIKINDVIPRNVCTLHLWKDEKKLNNCSVVIDGNARLDDLASVIACMAERYIAHDPWMRAIFAPGVIK